MKKSIIINGYRVTKHNLEKFSKDYYGSNLLLDYLRHLAGVDNMPCRLDHWVADGTMYCYQCGSKYIYLHKNEKDVVNAWNV